MNEGEKVYPAIAQFQAGRLFYTVAMSMRDLAHLSLPDPKAHAVERNQRKISKIRVNAIARYIRKNPKNYVMPPVTLIIDGKTEFLPTFDNKELGMLKISKNAKIHVVDGQHRVASFQQLIENDPDTLLKWDMISVTIFLDFGGQVTKQMFADMNANAKRPSPSLTRFYDFRDVYADVARQIVAQDPLLYEVIEFEANNAGKQKLWTFSAIYDFVKLSYSNDSKPSDNLRILADKVAIVMEWIKKQINIEAVLNEEVAIDFEQERKYSFIPSSIFWSVIAELHKRGYFEIFSKIDWKLAGNDLLAIRQNGRIVKSKKTIAEAVEVIIKKYTKEVKQAE